jgi:CheY-like chemotaxis protein
MHNNIATQHHRILVIDDNPAIHEDFRKIFCSSTESEDALSVAEAALFDEPSGQTMRHEFQIDSAYQGQEGLALVQQARTEDNPYAMAFVDVRMPPGWDGIETTAKIWEEDPDLQIVICTAYSDYSWDEMVARLPKSDQLLILKKPFDTVEVLQMGHALTEKWRLQKAVKFKLDFLQRNVDARTKVLEAEIAKLHAEIKRLTKIAA